MELISSAPFLIIAGVLALFLVIGIAKRAIRFLMWITALLAVLILLGIVYQLGALEWIESLFKNTR